MIDYINAMSDIPEVNRAAALKWVEYISVHPVTLFHKPEAGESVQGDSLWILRAECADGTTHTHMVVRELRHDA